ncbi:MAG TPA: aspartate-semialdehyde dehydrogenase [Bacteroidales bacterium]|nr:aspartate-semialdehyde dehydrogenase [Bacteroidales bacterium]
MKIALVGATGMVGEEMIKVLEEFNFPCSEFIPSASERSVGKELTFKGKTCKVVGLKEAVALQPDIVLFSAGASTSLEWAGEFAKNGSFVIDNSSAWRLYEDVPLVVPEVNGHTLAPEKKIIANPNCSTIQLVVALAPLHRAFGIKRLVIATYQSVTGTGVKAVKQMEDERLGIKGEKAYPWPIDLNCFPHGGSFAEDGYTTEELKLLHESRKILEAPELKVTATVVRIPVIGGHSEAVNIEFERPFELSDVRNMLETAPGVIVQDQPAQNIYPMPLTSHKKNEVFVGRLRRDNTVDNGLNMWIVADNLRKGAATNAVQIALMLKERGWV